MKIKPPPYLEKFYQALDSSLKNKAIEIPPPLGSGFIKNFRIEKGVYIRYYKCYFNQRVLFKWFPNSFANNSTLIFTTEALPDIAIIDDNNLTNYAFKNATALYAINHMPSETIVKNQIIHRLAIAFDTYWLKENFNGTTDEFLYIIGSSSKKEPLLISGSINFTQYELLKELIKEMNKVQNTLVKIKIQSLALLNDLITNIIFTKKSKQTINYSLHRHTMIQVEKRLKEHLDKPMPSITQLAAEFSISTSTLKRHFKIIYGKSIYNYYLEKKLELGKKMILSKNKSISEIAYNLGYSKINSFSKAFKKYYGILPKEASKLRIFL